MSKKIWIFILPVLAFSIGFAVSFVEQEQESVDLSSSGVLQTSYKAFVSGIYSTADDVKRFSFEKAYPYVVDWKVTEYIDSLPLDEKPTVDKEIKARIHARLKSPEFFREIVPFLWKLKTQYSAVEDPEMSFDTWARKTISPLSPGSEHKLFSFEPDRKPNRISMPSKEVVAKVVLLYDALYLQNTHSPLKYNEQPSEALIARAVPLVKSIFEAYKDSVEPEGVAGTIFHQALSDPHYLETITVTLLMAVSQESYKAFQTFSKKLLREQDLKAWMTARANDPKLKPELIAYLKYAQDERRYAIHVTVDGLQGHLVESLSQNQYKSLFIKGLVEDEQAPKVPSGTKVTTFDQSKISRNFMTAFSKTGYVDFNYLPFFRRLYTGRNGIATSGISTTPTISVRNLPIVKTGADVTGASATGIPNFHFVDRKDPGGNGRGYYFYGNDALLLEKIAERSHMKTMYERLKGLNTYNCDAQYEKDANYVYNAFLNLAIGEGSRDFGDARCASDLKRRSLNEIKLRGLRSELLSLLDPSWWRKKLGFSDGVRISQLIAEISNLEDDGLPQYINYYNPWPDHFAHFVGPFSDAVVAPTGELNRLDFWLGKFEKAYRDAGLSSRLVWGMAGDHGLTPVSHQLNPEIEVFGDLAKRGVKLVVEKLSSDEGEGPLMHHPTKPKSMRGKDVVIASTAGGNYMMDFFIHDQANWSRQPLFHELSKWRTLEGRELDILSIIVAKLHDSLEYLVVREETCTHDGGGVRLLAARDGKIVAARVFRRGQKVFYESTADLLGVRQLSKYDLPPLGTSYEKLTQKCLELAKRDDLNTWCSEEEWRELTSYSNKPDSVVQIAHIYDTDLAGTVNLFPRAGIGYNTTVTGRHAGEHFHEKDAFVGFWGQPLSPEYRPRSVVNGSVAPTLYEYLTGKPVVVGEDGWGFPSILGHLRAR